jgi:hypothetical protein
VKLRIKVTNGVVSATSGEAEVTEVTEASATSVETRAWIGGRRMIATRETRVTGTNGTGIQGTSLAETTPGETIVAVTDSKTGDVEIEVVVAAGAGAGVEGVEGAVAAAVVAVAAKRMSSRPLSSCSQARSIWALSSRCGDTWTSRAQFKALSRQRA